MWHTQSVPRRTRQIVTIADSAAAVTPVAERDHVSYHSNGHGRFRLTVACEAQYGAVIITAIELARDALFATANTDITLIDTIVEIAQRSLAAVGSESRADRFRVLVHLDTDGLFLHQGRRLPPFYTVSRVIKCPNNRVNIRAIKHSAKHLCVNKIPGLSPANQRAQLSSR